MGELLRAGCGVELGVMGSYLELGVMGDIELGVVESWVR